MPDSVETIPAPAPKPSAKVVVTQSLPFTPIAVRLPVKTRATMEKLVAELKPEGKPNPALVEVAKNTTLALMNMFPSATGFAVMIESNAGQAAQLNIIVNPLDL